mmetsp:Transcript_1232/g.1978  ORF Transcript_1232/g.1978 Transcript_1232/m.1978 type:complete len:223 (+) Transcript_1232:1591-2259(+)
MFFQPPPHQCVSPAFARLSNLNILYFKSASCSSLEGALMNGAGLPKAPFNLKCFTFISTSAIGKCIPLVVAKGCDGSHISLSEDSELLDLSLSVSVERRRLCLLLLDDEAVTLLSWLLCRREHGSLIKRSIFLCSEMLHSSTMSSLSRSSSDKGSDPAAAPKSVVISPFLCSKNPACATIALIIRAYSCAMKYSSLPIRLISLSKGDMIWLAHSCPRVEVAS